MKVGTDAVLLGSWLRCEPEDRELLDIGCGTGIITLMAAQRAQLAHVTGIDIDGISAKEAAANVSASKWSERIEIHPISLQKMVADGKYGMYFDHIFSNPPYFSDSLKSPSGRKTAARHCDDTLPFATLAESVSVMLKTDGRFSIVLPTETSDIFAACAAAHGLYPSRICRVKTSSGKPVKRILSEFTRMPKHGEIEMEELTIQEKGAYTEQYRLLTKDFHPFF